jgi:hypothetical protein
VLSGASLVLPTGKYSATTGPDIGVGNFTTLHPTIQVAYLPTPDIGIATKLSLGLNTRNRDNDLRSGNWVGLVLAAVYKRLSASWDCTWFIYSNIRMTIRIRWAPAAFVRPMPAHSSRPWCLVSTPR